MKKRYLIIPLFLSSFFINSNVDSAVFELYDKQNNNLLIGDHSSVNTKPQLEIFADDVKCSHGCTIGQLDKSALFYLKTRGIAEKEAKGLLTYAFANNVLENVKMQVLKTKIKKIIARKIGVNLGFEL